MINLNLKSVFYSILSPLHTEDISIKGVDYCRGIDYIKHLCAYTGTAADLQRYIHNLYLEEKLFMVNFSMEDFYMSKFGHDVPKYCPPDLIKTCLKTYNVDLALQRRQFIYAWIGTNILNIRKNPGEKPSQYIRRLSAENLKSIEERYPKIEYKLPPKLKKCMQLQDIYKKSTVILAKIIVWVRHVEDKTHIFDKTLAAILDTNFNIHLSSGDPLIDRIWIQYLYLRNKNNNIAPDVIWGYKNMVYTRYKKGIYTLRNNVVAKLKQELNMEITPQDVNDLYFHDSEPIFPEELTNDLWNEFVLSQTELHGHKITDGIFTNLDKTVDMLLARLKINKEDIKDKINLIRGIILGINEPITENIIDIKLQRCNLKEMLLFIDYTNVNTTQK